MATAPVYATTVGTLAKLLKVTCNAGWDFLDDCLFFYRAQRAVALHAPGKRTHARPQIECAHDLFELFASISVS